ncbi:hypothetical protein [Streptomyces lutosisoli]|uniref:Lipoprotein n=1 Tax=Streptomyces lutosisoli TaxID=2665721 RepID=A0ABW2VK50_9ACTN
MAAVLAAEAALVSLETGAAFAADSGTTDVTATKASETKSAASSADSVAAALLTARLQDRKIEVLSERFGDLDDVRTAEWCDADVHVFRADPAGGGRQLAGHRYLAVGHGSVARAGGAAADIAVSDGGDTALVSVDKGDKPFGLGWESKLPAPSVKDDTASYDLGDGQTLTVTALSQGFSQNVILDSAPEGAWSTTFP